MQEVSCVILKMLRIYGVALEGISVRAKVIYFLNKINRNVNYNVEADGRVEGRSQGRNY